MMMIYLFTAIRLTPGGSSTVHIYKKIHRTTQSTQKIRKTTHLTNWEVLEIMARIHFVYLLGS